MSSPVPSFLLSSTPLPAPSPTMPIRCEFEVVTPMYLAGADQFNIAGELLRPASLKGVLRWWWRCCQKEIDHQVLLEKETNIWGGLSTDKKSPAPRGIELRIPPHGNPDITHIPPNKGSAEYYLGYGLGKSGETPARPGFAHGHRVQATILVHRNEQKDAVISALKLLSAFGGLGSRSRRSWGSLQLLNDPNTDKESPPCDQPGDVEAMQKRLLESLPTRNMDGAQVARSFLGANSRCATAKVALTHKQLLESVHGIFKDGEKLHKDAWCFGLPHTKGKQASPDGPRDIKVDRRASPILVKATKLSGTDRYALSALLLDGAFLEFPKGSRDMADFTQQKGRLQRFMDRLENLDRPISAAAPRRR